jgi:hypothetical protein
MTTQRTALEALTEMYYNNMSNSREAYRFASEQRVRACCQLDDFNAGLHDTMAQAAELAGQRMEALGY